MKAKLVLIFLLNQNESEEQYSTTNTSIKPKESIVNKIYFMKKSEAQLNIYTHITVEKKYQHRT